MIKRLTPSLTYIYKGVILSLGMGFTKYEKIIDIYNEFKDSKGYVENDKFTNEIIAKVGSEKRSLDSSKVILTKFFLKDKNGYKLRRL